MFLLALLRAALWAGGVFWLFMALVAFDLGKANATMHFLFLAAIFSVCEAISDDAYRALREARRRRGP